MTLLEVRGAPNYYSCKQGILESLPAYLLDHKLQRAIILHGEKSWEKASPYFPAIPSCEFEKYNGECSVQEIQRVSRIIQDRKRDVIIGVGGGKVLDLAKSSGNECDIPVILIPTLPSNCAAWTPLSVIYNEEGQFLHYTIYKNSSLAVFVEPEILLTSPSSYLRAGIGDTLAKWYEADAIIRHETSLPVPIQVAHESARLCKINLLADGLKALNDIEKKDMTLELVRVFETIIAAAGMVGGFGDRFGRIAGAHSIHNGLTHLPETHHLLHGDKVAYGILVQLILENQVEEIIELLPFYKALGLPYNLATLGLHNQTEQVVKTIAHYSVLPHESIHLLHFPITEGMVQDAIYSLEKTIQEHSN